MNEYLIENSIFFMLSMTLM